MFACLKPEENQASMLFELSYTVCFVNKELKNYMVSGYFGMQQKECEEKSCCWSPVEANRELLQSQNGVPWCFYPEQKAGYVMKSIDKTGAFLKYF